MLRRTIRKLSLEPQHFSLVSGEKATNVKIEFERDITVLQDRFRQWSTNKLIDENTYAPSMHLSPNLEVAQFRTRAFYRKIVRMVPKLLVVRTYHPHWTLSRQCHDESQLITICHYFLYIGLQPRRDSSPTSCPHYQGSFPEGSCYHSSGYGHIEMERWSSSYWSCSYALHYLPRPHHSLSIRKFPSCSMILVSKILKTCGSYSMFFYSHSTA